MYLEKLILLNFKNYEEATLDLSPGINVLVGKNGSGKTNILDAIYFLSLTKSAVSSADLHCVRLGQQFFMLKGVYNKEGAPVEIAASFQAGKKILRENQQEYDRLSDHIGKFPVVLMSPDDTDLVKEGSELRRKFFDGIICQLDKVYLDHLITYGQALKQRNSLLKIFYERGKIDMLALESYDRLLIQAGEYIYRARVKFIADFEPVYQKYFSFLVLEGESTTLKYVSPLHETEFEQGLKQSRDKDLLLQRTSFGVHRDDFVFLMGVDALKKLGSQGQQKSFVICLRLAQFEMLRSKKGFNPILLLDDVFDKLDDSRIHRLLKLLGEGKGQLLLTDARSDRTLALLEEAGLDALVFEVSNGVVKKQGNHAKKG